MRNYVIINGVNSLTIQGLAIKTMPPITKPIQRTLREEIDGRDGDLVTELGYGAYDKTIEIGLFGTFDIDEVIAYFNQKGTITFSNEADKVYYFQALEQVDYAELLKFRTANVVLHCQPFKYPTEETPLEEEYEYVTGTGTDITLDNTEETEFNEIELQGNTYQEQTTGLQVFDNNRLNPSLSANLIKLDTGIELKNIWASNVITTDTLKALFKPNTTYTCRSMTTIKSRPSTISQVQSFLLLYRANSSPYGGYNKPVCVVGNPRANPLNTPTETINTFTTPSDLTDLYLLGYTFYGNNDGTTTYSANGDIELNELMIVEGTYTASNFPSYQPYTYGPTPNPNYPQDIHVVSGDNTIEIIGKNFFDINGDIESATSGYQYTIDGTTLIVPSSTGNAGQLVFDKSYKGDTYKLSFTKISGTFRIVLRVYNNGTLVTNQPPTGFSQYNGTYQGYFKDCSSSPVDIIVPSEYTFKIDFVYTNWSAKDIQLEKGNQATPYEAYIGETYPISLGNLEMASIPNTTYKDLFVRDNEGTWYKRQVIGKVVYDGTEANWSSNTSGSNKIFYREIIGKSGATGTNVRVFANYFTYNSGLNWQQLANGEITMQSNSDYIFIRYDEAQIIGNFKTWLGTHNTIIYYILETPTDTEITNETLIEQLEAIWNATSYRGQTNITQVSNDLPFMMEVSALKLGSDHLEINNTGNIYSKPTIELEGTGIVDIYLNDVQVFEVDLSEENKITIDTEKMEAYTDTGLANRKVTGDYSTFKLNVGTNDLRFSGALTSATITRYLRWL